MNHERKFASKAKSALLVTVVVLATCGSALVLGAQRSYADSTTPPAWDTFSPTDGATYGSNTSPAGYGSVGGLLFYNSLGQQITGGSTTTTPFAAYAKGATATGGVKAQLYFALPAASDPSGWSSFNLGNAATFFPNASAPSNLSSGSQPVFTGAGTEQTLSSFAAENPDGGNPDPGYYQVQMFTSGTGSNGTVENAADILIDTTNNTWTLAYSYDEFNGGTASTPSPVGTTTTVSSVTTSPVVAGNPVDLSASVADADSSSPDGGTVQFFEQIGAGTATAIGSPVTVSGGTATFDYTTSNADVGNDNYTAQFTPATGTNYSTSTSATPVALDVTSSGGTSTSTVLTASPTSPQTFGTSETLTATITPSAATGTVQFEDAGNDLGSAVAVSSGQAQLVTAALPVGNPDDLSAVFTPTGGNGYAGSTGTLNFVVNAISTSTVLTASPTSPQTFGTSETLTAAITPSAATGTVQFKDAGANLGSAVAVSGGQAQLVTAALPVGNPDALSAVFTPTAGNGYSGSTGNLNFVVNAISTSTALSASPTSPQYAGTSETLTATITPSGATGTVQFEVGGVNIGSAVAVSSGQAQLVTSALPVGNPDALSAVFTPTAGNGYSGSTGNLNFVVNAVTPTSTALSVLPTSPQLAGTSETLTATVTPSGATGTVQFEVGGANIGSAVAVSSGQAQLVTSSLPVGNPDALSAVFNPTAGNGYSGSTGTLNFVVVPVPPAPPSGATSSQGATSTTPNGTATATESEATVVASGTGSLTVSTYASNPSGVAVSDGTGVYYDASVASGSTFTSLTITVCDPGSGNALQWFDGTSWFNFSDVATVNGCLVATVTNATSPTLGQLTGTPIAVVVENTGYTLGASDGGVFNFGTTYYGSEGGKPLAKPIVGIARTPSGNGYWLVASDGGVFNFGDAGFYGSEGGTALTKPVVGIASTPSGHGYWLVASDGGVFAFGDAGFYGSEGGTALTKPVVGIAPTQSGHGYWLVASDGGVFNLGDATFQGSAGGDTLTAPVVGIAGG